MDAALFVRGFKGLGEFALRWGSASESDIVPCAMTAERSSPSTSSIISACAAVGFFDAVEPCDVRMVQRREHFGFALKAREPIVVSREQRRQNLDGDLAFELRIRRAVDLAHAAGSNGRDDLIWTETGAGSEGQLWRRLYGREGPLEDQSRKTPLRLLKARRR